MREAIASENTKVIYEYINQSKKSDDSEATDNLKESRTKEILKEIFRELSSIKNIAKWEINDADKKIHNLELELARAKANIEKLNTHTALIGETYHCRKELVAKFGARFNKELSQWAVPNNKHPQAQEFVDKFNIQREHEIIKLQNSFKIDDIIQHKEFGKGIILSINNSANHSIIKIKFDDETRKILNSIDDNFISF